MMAALCLSGLPTDRFYFEGFLPPKATARGARLSALTALDATLVFFESPKRLAATLGQMQEIFGATRQVAVCRELTKKFEQVLRGYLQEVCEDLENLQSFKGECVIVVGPPEQILVDDASIDAALATLLRTHRVKEASAIVAQTLNVARKLVYARALALKDSAHEDQSNDER